jgi:hypothetical protein
VSVVFLMNDRGAVNDGFIDVVPTFTTADGNDEIGSEWPLVYGA